MRSYASEILKLFPYLLDKDYPSLEAFVQDFSKSGKSRLSNREICSLAARPKATEVITGLYAIKGSGAFCSLVEAVNA